MNEYRFEFKMYHFNTDAFKQKQAQILIDMFGKQRLSINDMMFDKYGIITYDTEDRAHKFPIVSECDEFNKKVNCLIFNLPITDKNNGKYDKCFIYQSLNVKVPNYGFVLFNTKTNDSMHKFFIDYDPTDLFQTLNKTFFRLKFKDTFINHLKKNNYIPSHLRNRKEDKLHG